MILDSSFLIALGRHDQAAFETGVSIAERGDIQWVPTPVIAELEYGVEMVGDADERRRTRNVLRMYPHVEINAEFARCAGQLLAAADKDAGGPGNSGADDIDALIAGVATVLEDTVLTDNVADFEALGVEIETW
ncbi:PIN domain-containing protein [Natronosalvus caseinilyticus]|uniref:PIN domain-containing protein n=1 Tax=Natronosalvus caseinilyticus TaxID=2953747 RepID=UPI0028A8623A|nr:PIN domain-containing protein [Natronosalvus caseinilyticus]